VRCPSGRALPEISVETLPLACQAAARGPRLSDADRQLSAIPRHVSPFQPPLPSR